MWPRLITGKRKRGTRLHNHAGRLLDAAGFRYLPRSLLTTLSLKLANRRAELPLLSFRAIKRLDRLIAPDWKVLEFGSGMSTIWFARRCGALVSVETDRGWYDSVSKMLAERGLGNVDYRFRAPSEAHVLEEYEDSHFDLALVDGVARDCAMMTAIAKVKPGGYIYMDNTDSPDRSYKVARSMLLRAAGGEANVQVFNDLTPSRVYVTEGTLARVSNKMDDGG